MKKTVNVLIYIALACFFGGLYTALTGTYTFFIGMLVMGAGWIFALSAAVLTAKLIQQQNKQTEDRIKILEEEIEMLKLNSRQ